MELEELVELIRESIKAEDGAGSDLEIVSRSYDDGHIYVKGDLDIQHLAGEILYHQGR